MAFALSHTLASTSGTISPKTSGTLLLSLPSKANSRHFSSQNISVKPLWPPHLEQSPPRHQALCCSLFLQKPTQDISLPRIFQLNHIVLHSYQSVQCECVCVCIFCIIMLEHLSIYIYTYFLDNIFHLDVCYVCMLVQCLEPQGRCCTNFHYYY